MHHWAVLWPFQASEEPRPLTLVRHTLLILHHGTPRSPICGSGEKWECPTCTWMSYVSQGTMVGHSDGNSYFRKSPGVHCTLRIRPLVIPLLQLLQGCPLPHQPCCLTPCAMSLNLSEPQLYYVSCRNGERMPSQLGASFGASVFLQGPYAWDLSILTEMSQLLTQEQGQQATALFDTPCKLRKILTFLNVWKESKEE